MNTARNANWPRLAALSTPIPAVKPPGIRRTDSLSGLRPYCSTCPQCGGMHRTKAQFIACRVEHKGI